MERNTLAIVAIVIALGTLAFVVHEENESPFEEAAEEFEQAFEQ